MIGIKYQVEIAVLGNGKHKTVLTIHAVTDVNGTEFQSDKQLMSIYQIDNFFEACSVESLLDLLKTGRTTGDHELYFIKG